MLDLKLDRNNDLLINDGDISTTSTGYDLLAQRMTITLKAFKGEWFLNPSWGAYDLDLFSNKGISKTLIDSYFKSVILSFPEVNEITFFSSSFDTKDRFYSFTFQVDADVETVNVQIDLRPPTVEVEYPAPTDTLDVLGCTTEDTDFTGLQQWYDYLSRVIGNIYNNDSQSHLTYIMSKMWEALQDQNASRYVVASLIRAARKTLLELEDAESCLFGLTQDIPHPNELFNQLFNTSTIFYRNEDSSGGWWYGNLVSPITINNKPQAIVISPIAIGLIDTFVINIYDSNTNVVKFEFRSNTLFYHQSSSVTKIEGIKLNEAFAVVVMGNGEVRLYQNHNLIINTNYNLTVGNDYQLEVGVNTSLGNDTYIQIVTDASGVFTAIDNTDIANLEDFCGNAVVVGGVDKSQLLSLINQANALDEEDYTTDTWQYLPPALDHAEFVYNNNNASQADVNDAVTTLQSALNILVERASMDALLALISQAQTYDEEDYNPSAWPPFSNELQDAIETSQSLNLPQSVVDQQTSDLQDAIDELLANKTDKTALQQAITTANSKTESAYTPLSWSGMQTALTQAENVNNTAPVEQSVVDQATDDLNTAINNLVVVADKTALEAKIIQAEAIVNDHYSQSSWAALQQAITHAHQVDNDPNVSQTTVDQEVVDLQAAIDGLTQAGVPWDNQTPWDTGVFWL